MSQRTLLILNTVTFTSLLVKADMGPLQLGPYAISRFASPIVTALTVIQLLHLFVVIMCLPDDCTSTAINLFNQSAFSFNTCL